LNSSMTLGNATLVSEESGGASMVPSPTVSMIGRPPQRVRPSHLVQESSLSLDS
jgi:hypothetical protein